MNPPPPPPIAAPLHHIHPDLPTALSSLTSLLHLSTSTLHSFPIPTSSQTTTLLPCPSNPNHHLPPSSLFSHHLTCPSSIPLTPPNYPHTLQSTTPPPSLPSTTSDLHFSLESYFTNNFFYRNCPSPVTPAPRRPPILILPPILYLECTDFSKGTDHTDTVDLDFVRFLPSEIWAIRSELEAWNGDDARFSIRVMRAILRLRDCELSRVCEWIVARSPRYGVIIDYPMRDHVVVLVRLCLKAIVRETFGLVGFMFGGDEAKMEESELSLSSRGFDCPVFRDVLVWLASQFGLLYGEVNGKFFAFDVLRECILELALSGSLFTLEETKSEIVKGDYEGCKKTWKNVGEGVISVSQVAAAVAALHERSLIEENIRTIREARPLSVYQRNMEHSHLSKIADEERHKRPDYRPIIQHDGLSWQRSQNQDANKEKTREELLAEERDYKRRRMSYRGKKLKRSTVEVMRDIIEEYMEDIKKFGEMSSTSKAVEEVEVENKHQHDDDKKHDYKDPDDDFQHYSRDSSLDHEFRDSNRNVRMVKDSRDDHSDIRDARRRSSHSREHHHKEIRDEEASKEGSSRSSYRNVSKSHEERYDKREKYGHGNDDRKRRRDEEYSERRDKDKRDFEEASEEGSLRRLFGNGMKSHEDHYDKREKYGHEHDTRTRGINEDYREDRDSGRVKRKRDVRERNEEDSRHNDRERRKTNRNSSSLPERHSDRFEDRYNPLESGEIYEE